MTAHRLGLVKLLINIPPMRTYQPYQKRSRFPTLLFGGLAAALLGGGGLLLTLSLLGVDLNPFRKALTEDPFMVRIPVNAQPIPAYTRVDRMHLINPRTGGLTYQKVPPTSTVGMSVVGIDQAGTSVEGRVEAIRREGDEVVFIVNDGREVPQSQARELGGALMNVNSLIGRVVRQDKRAGMGFQESTFFPQGTPEGLAGATPEGMRALTLDASRLVGVHSLNAGDRIDLMASLTAEDAAAVKLSTGISGGSSRRGDSGTETVMLAQDALVLKPVYVRNEAATSSSLTQGTRVQNVPKYEVAIALKPEDVVPVQAALNRSLPITLVAHSMKPAAGGEVMASPVRNDMVAVPVTVKSIEAYAVITRDAFISPATRKLRTELVSRAQVERTGVITSLDEMLGAIARQDIPPGCYLRRSDLLSGPPGSTPDTDTEPAPAPNWDDELSTSRPDESAEQWVTKKPPAATESASPERTVTTTAFQAQPPTGDAIPGAMAVGDRPAITRFIPAGRSALAIPWNRLYGAEHLQIGDRIDLMASFSLRQRGKVDEQETRPDGTVILRRADSLQPDTTDRTSDESIGFRAEPWFVATDAVVIAPVGFPAPAAALRALGALADRPAGAGSEQGTQPNGPLIIVAIEEGDVETLTTALATTDALFTVTMRSGEFPVKLAAGEKRIVVASETLSPYQAFTEQGWKGNRRQPATRVVSSNDSRFADAITLEEVNDYYGRTLAGGKSRGDHFTADDFLPPGTPAGLAAGARPGHTMWVVADNDIAGLESFEAGDRIAILSRGISDSRGDRRLSSQEPSPGAAGVIVPRVRIARRSTAGQTVLEVAAAELSVLQAAIAKIKLSADSVTELIAVALPRPVGSTEDDAWDSAELPNIAAFDPRAPEPLMESMEVIIGSSRRTYQFSVDSPGGGTP